MTPTLLTQPVYAVSHVILMATDYGATYASAGDEKILNDRYGMHDQIVAQLREIGESDASIPGLYELPEGWSFPADVAGGYCKEDIVWDNLHRAVTCIMGVSSWIKEHSPMKQRPLSRSLFCFKDRNSGADERTVKKQRAAAKPAVRIRQRPSKEVCEPWGFEGPNTAKTVKRSMRTMGI
ncbi:hypothetical protein BVRB_020160 [Beta vulgaris subsp. vulgaris]|uniref:Uncharacterized protein n=1 Tax=Beta vulgaris subsp. vulgaris TaxID=3555 RepID=A0A0J8B3Z6_BETVV|nr:hypothetical protein BVRB_020160 [Beta vulgaris subsp. vulgaris]